MPCSGFDTELYDLYSLGALERVDAAPIEDHLRTDCATCTERIRESLGRTALLALTVPAISPPRRLRSRVVASVSPTRTGFWEFLRSPGLAWGMAAVFLVVGSALTWYLRAPVIQVSQIPGPVVLVPAPPAEAPPARRETSSPVPDARVAELTRSVADAQSKAAALSVDVAQQQAKVAQLQQELRARDAQLASQQHEMQVLQARNPAVPPNDGQLQDVRRQLASTQQQVEELTRQVRFYQTAIQSQRLDIERNMQLVSLLSSPALRLLDLRATEQGGSASAHALLADNAQILFYASHLPALPAARTYQLWLMRSRGPAVVSGGIFQPDRSQRAMLTVPNAADIRAITALAVTEEPAGGRPLPTGHKILIGTLKG